MCPTVFWATIAHQPSRSKHCRHSSSGHISAPGKCCPQHNHRSTPGLQPDSTLQRLIQSSLLPTCWATLLRRATLPSCSIGPQHLSRANAALTQLVHGCTAHSHRQTGHSPPTTSATAGQSLCPQHLPTLSLHALVQARPELAPSTSTPLNICTALFRAPHIHKGVTTQT